MTDIVTIVRVPAGNSTVIYTGYQAWYLTIVVRQDPTIITSPTVQDMTLYNVYKILYDRTIVYIRY